MKKKFLMLLTMLSAVIGTYADNTLTATGSIAKASGSMGTLSVSLSNDVDIKGVQFNLTLPEGISVVDPSVTSRATGFSATYTASNGLLTLSTTSETTAIAAGEGDIVTFTIKANSELTAGTARGTLSGIVLSTSGTSSLTPANISYNIEITDGVVLDENSTALPVTQGPVDVTVKRTLKGGVWNTLCLPFAVDASTIISAITAAGGGSTSICYLSDCTTSGTTISVSFGSYNSGSLSANYPIIVKPTNDVSSFNFAGVSIFASETDNTAVVETGSGPGKQTVATFIGTLRARTTIPADNIFLGTDNKFYYSDGSNTIKGFRGYFYLKDFKSSDPSRQIKLMVDGEEATGIEGLYINGEAVAEGVYNLKGQRVDMPTQKGVYIKDGKKVVIK